MKKTLTLLLSSLLVAGMATFASAWEENVDYVVVGANAAEAYSVTKAGYPECTTGQLLTGTIAQTLTKIEDGHGADQMFDGNKDTYFKASDAGGFAYLILDQAYQLTEIRCAPTTAQDIRLDTHFGLMIQGSNDGENWVTIIQRGRDAQNADYRIYNPTIAEEQAYQAAGFGYKSGLDGSIWWRGNPDYAFSMYRVFDATVGEIEFYGVPAEATDTSTPEKASALDFASSHYYPGNIHVMEDAEVVTVDGSLSGTVIGAGGAWAGATYERTFNGNAKRCFDPPVEGPQCWVGLKMDQPYALTEIRVLPKRDEHGRNNTLYSQVQGSIDGVNWRTLAVFTEIPDSQVYMTKTVTDTNGYTYFRYVNCGTRQSSCADLLLFGAPAAAAEPFTAGPVIATHNYFGGEIELAAAKNTISDTEISGTPICGRYYYGWTDRSQGMEAAFDGDLTTGYGAINGRLGVQQWVGLKPDVTTVANTVMLNRAYFDAEGTLAGVSNIDDDYYFQGSVDGENWVDLAVFAEGVDTADAEGWITKTVEDTNGYNYFRMLNSNVDNWDTGISFNEMKIYGEAAAVEPPVPVSDIYNYYGEIVYTCVTATEIADNSIIGEVIGGANVTEGNLFEYAFDGDIGTFYNGTGAIFDMWVGLKTQTPAVVKSFTIATQDNDGDGVSDRRHAMWGSRLQGSNDGIVWEDIYVYEYTDFEDYANDTESTWLTIELPDNETAYTYFRMINNDDGANALAELQLFTEAKEPVVYPAYPAYDHIIFAEEYPDLDVAFGENYPGSTTAGIPACTTGTLLEGAVATSVNSSGIFAWNGLDTRFNPANAFDGKNDTFFYAFNQSAMYHPILILDQAYELTEIRLFTYPSAAVPTTDHLIQGSNDGENWVTIVHIPTIETDSYVVFTPGAHGYEGYIDYSECWVGSGSYSMYRYINTNGTTYNGVSDIEFYGVPAEATVVTPDMIVEPDLSINHYPGTVDVTDKTSVSTDGSLVGTIVGGGGGWNGHNYDHAFDGNTNTYFDPNYSSPICWVGIKLDAPTVLTGVKIYPVYQLSELGRLRRIEGGFIQGSNDGENWTTILAYTPADIPTTGEWIEKTCESAEAYTYFRYVNNGLGHGEAAEILFFGETVTDAAFDLVDVDTAAGQEIEIEIYVDTKVPVNSVALYELTYDADVLTFVEFTGFGELVTESVFGDGAVDNEQVTLMFALDEAAAINGLVAKIKFVVNAEAAEGETEVTMVSLVKNDSEIIRSAVDSAIVTIGKLTGDINGDNVVDIQDALYLFQHTMEPDLYPVEGNYDFVADGVLDIQDALYLFQHSMLPELYPLA